MATEVNNLIAPYSSLVYILTWFSEADYEKGRAGASQASGILVSDHDVLTASHVVYDTTTGRSAYRIEITPAYDAHSDSNPNVAEVPYGTFLGTNIAYNANIDPNRDGKEDANDGNPSTLGGAELDVALIHFSNINDAPLPLAFHLGTGFTQGYLRMTGYPASSNGNPVELIQNLSQDNGNNDFRATTPGAGSSGGPVWNYVNGVARDYGVIATTGAVASLAAHANWLSQYLANDVEHAVGSSQNDIFHPYIDEFKIGRYAGFKMAGVVGYSIQGGGTSPLWNLSIDGGAGTDTIALPWNTKTSQFSDALLPYEPPAPFGGVPTVAPWEVTWTKSSTGVISGTVQVGSYAMTFQNVERIAFADGTLDLTKVGVGQTGSIGTQSPVTSTAALSTTLPNVVTRHVTSLAGSDTDSDAMYGSDGDDELYGLGGDDQFLPGLGTDVVDGGTGTDTLVIDYSASTQPIGFSVSAKGTTDGYKGTIVDGVGDSVAFDDIEAFDITTGAGDDVLLGGAGDDRFTPGGGANIVEGGAGADQLISQTGRDLLIGGLGADDIQLGSGFGLVGYTSTADGGDTIEGFVSGSQRIGLIGDQWGAFTVLQGTGDLVAPPTFAYVYYNQTTGVLSYGAAGAAPVVLATLTGAPVLAAGDIVPMAFSLGMAGAAGAAGTATSLAGRAGAAGASATAVHKIASGSQLISLAKANGAAGGRGGDGAASMKTGGAAGAGGAGGRASATTATAGDTAGGAASSQAEATGGHGGVAGARGTGPNDVVNGAGASGGAGGSASATAQTQSSGSASAVAYGAGGAGGDAVGSGHTGGAGGAASAGATARSSAASSALAAVSAIGGIGGDGTAGANGGAGGRASISNGIVASTVGGTLLVGGSATGGQAGMSDTGTGGAGGAAAASLSLSDTIAAHRSVGVQGNIAATGGGGGASSTGHGGAGGAASAVLSLTGAGQASVQGSATAIGGAGGTGTPTHSGLGGAASARVAARGATVASVADATGGAGNGTSATATAIAAGVGLAGTISATASSDPVGRTVSALVATATGVIQGGGTVAATGTALAQVGVALAKPVFNTSDQSVAQLVASPTAAEVKSILTASRNPKLTAAFPGAASTHTFFAVGEIGGAFDSKGASGASETVTQTLTMTIDPSQVPNPQNLVLGLYGAKSVGTGLTALDFDVTATKADGSTVDLTGPQSFSSASTAAAYFHDHPVDLGPLADLGAQPFSLHVKMSEIFAKAGSSFYTGLLVGDPPPVVASPDPAAPTHRADAPRSGADHAATMASLGTMIQAMATMLSPAPATLTPTQPSSHHTAPTLAGSH